MPSPLWSEQQARTWRPWIMRGRGTVYSQPIGH
jgi:hypothetical protein